MTLFPWSKDVHVINDQSTAEGLCFCGAAPSAWQNCNPLTGQTFPPWRIVTLGQLRRAITSLWSTAEQSHDSLTGKILPCWSRIVTLTLKNLSPTRTETLCWGKLSPTGTELYVILGFQLPGYHSLPRRRYSLVSHCQDTFPFRAITKALCHTFLHE